MILQSSSILFVEGVDDKKVIEKLLIRRKINFDDFGILNCEGLQKLFKLLPGSIKAGSYETIGVIIDADENLKDRWKFIKNILVNAGYEKIPCFPDVKGIILQDEELPKIGIWLMPDNQAKGAIEEFICFLVPDNDDLLPVAENKIQKLIKEDKNRFKFGQKSKAVLHTWLAWQERPSKQLGSAVTYRLLNQNYLLDDGKADNFINWLKKLFK